MANRFGLDVIEIAESGAIPGSHWGAPEAGIIGNRLYVRPDTPLTSALHELCHVICMTPERRTLLDTDAGGDVLEECAVCYLSILLADDIDGYGQERMLDDMDAWGYSFRLGSAASWFESDAEDAVQWLLARGLVELTGNATWCVTGRVRTR